MRSLRAAVVVASLSLVAAMPAAAQPTTTPLIYCIPGQPNGCFAAAFDSSDGMFTIWLQNLEGTSTAPGVGLNLNFLIFTRLVDTHVIAGLDNSSTMAVEGNVYSVGGLFGYDGSSVPALDWPPGTVQELTHWHGTQIRGCTLPDPVVSSTVQTCPAAGLDGWVRNTFSAGFRPYIPPSGPPTSITRPPLTLDDINITIGTGNSSHFLSSGCTIYGANSGVDPGSYPTDRPACITTPYNVATVPEPATIALMSGGLLVLGGVGMLRRRHRERLA